MDSHALPGSLSRVDLGDGYVLHTNLPGVARSGEPERSRALGGADSLDDALQSAGLRAGESRRASAGAARDSRPRRSERAGARAANRDRRSPARRRRGRPHARRGRERRDVVDSSGRRRAARTVAQRCARSRDARPVHDSASRADERRRHARSRESRGLRPEAQDVLLQRDRQDSWPDHPRLRQEMGSEEPAVLHAALRAGRLSARGSVAHADRGRLASPVERTRAAVRARHVQQRRRVLDARARGDERAVEPVRWPAVRVQSSDDDRGSQGERHRVSPADSGRRRRRHRHRLP